MACSRAHVFVSVTRNQGNQGPHNLSPTCVPLGTRPPSLSAAPEDAVQSLKVKVMASIRKPKRIVIRGHDEREYPFLVKDGEDLRQDHRIQQLLQVMNSVLAHDAACGQRGLQMTTYHVVPMTSRCGCPSVGVGGCPLWAGARDSSGFRCHRTESSSTDCSAVRLLLVEEARAELLYREGRAAGAHDCPFLSGWG